jgi:hypothetical protein
VRARAPGHRDAVAGFFLRAGGALVHQRPRARRENHRLAPHGEKSTGLNIEQDCARDAAAVGRGQQLEAARVFETGDIAGEDLVAKSRHDFDARQVADVHRPVEGLSGKCLLVHASIGCAIEQASHPVLEFAHDPRRLADERPREVLIIEKPAAADRILEVSLDGVVFAEHDVVAALDHPSAAALAEHALRNEKNFASGARQCACSAAINPAPPVPRIRMSVVRFRPRLGGSSRARVDLLPRSAEPAAELLEERQPLSSARSNASARCRAADIAAVAERVAAKRACFARDNFQPLLAARVAGIDSSRTARDASAIGPT